MFKQQFYRSGFLNVNHCLNPWKGALHNKRPHIKNKTLSFSGFHNYLYIIKNQLHYYYQLNQ